MQPKTVAWCGGLANLGVAPEPFCSACSADQHTCTLKSCRLGIPDSNIVLMVADEVACNPRNPLPGEVHFDMSPQRANLYSGSVQVDYAGRDVNVQALLQVLTGAG